MLLFFHMHIFFAFFFFFEAPFDSNYSFLRCIFLCCLLFFFTTLMQHVSLALRNIWARRRRRNVLKEEWYFLIFFNAIAGNDSLLSKAPLISASNVWLDVRKIVVFSNLGVYFSLLSTEIYFCCICCVVL